MRKIELLAPAGDFECFKSAINAGADAIYIGGSNFNARINAINFSNEEIKEAIKYAHIHQVKVHVGINISLFEKDLKEVLNFIDFLYVNDVDALIVEDIGLINLILKAVALAMSIAVLVLNILNKVDIKSSIIMLSIGIRALLLLNF